ncbi:hypothetical protein M8818_006333 [Zalaria obscura]|uniref:Uncharacterized protein n=1 Tax=Zalaria obscura TaxID=2024903 RepID=A0ACC3S631_9PEZI
MAHSRSVIITWTKKIPFWLPRDAQRKRKRFRVNSHTRVGSLLNAQGDAKDVGSCCLHKDPGPRNVVSPDAVDNPAPRRAIM